MDGQIDVLPPPGEQRPFGRGELGAAQVFVDLDQLAVKVIQGEHDRRNGFPAEPPAGFQPVQPGDQLIAVVDENAILGPLGEH